MAEKTESVKAKILGIFPETRIDEYPKTIVTVTVPDRPCMLMARTVVLEKRWVEPSWYYHPGRTGHETSIMQFVEEDSGETHVLSGYRTCLEELDYLIDYFGDDRVDVVESKTRDS